MRSLKGYGRTPRMMAGLVASLEGTLMFIWMFVGLEPKSLTRVSAPLTVVMMAARPPKV